jgi:hypothetical protein
MSRVERLKSHLREHLPAAVSLVRMVRSLPKRMRPAEETFTGYYRDNGFRGKESQSGTGSGLVQTAALRVQLPLLLRELGASTLIDAPCGDFHWMREVDLSGFRYIGVDIVKPVVERLQLEFGNELRAFMARDLSKDPLPAGDLILCRDCLVHLSFKHGLAAIRNMKKSGSRYLLTTTFPDHRENHDIITGAWRQLNLQLPPFNLPQPMRLLDEQSALPDGTPTRKFLGLWLLSDL